MAEFRRRLRRALDRCSRCYRFRLDAHARRVCRVSRSGAWDGTTLHIPHGIPAVASHSVIHRVGLRALSVPVRDEPLAKQKGRSSVPVGLTPTPKRQFA